MSVVDLFLVLDDAELRRRFGAPTFDRAVEYVAHGRVLGCSHAVDAEGDLDVRGTVEGSAGVPYSTYVSVGVEDGTWIYSRCSCPVAEGCKHALALLLTVRERQQHETGQDGARPWERQLGSLLDELDEAAGTVVPAGLKPLGLQFDLKPPPRARWGTASGASSRGTLRMRPVQRGARDNWVRTGISWQQVPYAAHYSRTPQHPPRQLEVLAELLTAFRSASGGGYFGSETHLPLGAFGSGLWPLLRRVQETGMPLLADKGLGGLAVSAEPVTVQLDVNASAEGDAHLRLGVPYDDQWFGPGEMELLGTSGHGVALWLEGKRGWEVTLAPLTAPVAGQVRRLLLRPELLVVPPEDRQQLVADYLPRLQRHVPVISSDASIPLPDPVTPRLALTVHWVAADEVRVAWSFRYRVGTDDRVYALEETRGLRGIRRPELERRLLDVLDLDADQQHHLCRGRSRDLGLEPERTFRDGGAVAFAEDVLPGLRDQVEVDEIGDQPDYREAAGQPVIHFRSRQQDSRESAEPHGAEEGAEPGDPGISGEDDPATPVDARTDWLDLEVVVSVDGQFVALAHLLQALTLGKDRLVLRNGVHIRLDRPEFADLARLVDAAGQLHEQPDDGVRVSHHDLGLWDELAEVGIVDAQAAQWVKAARALRGLDALPEVDPVGLKAELRPYQLQGFRWLAYLWQCRLGGILADDMGLGKTLQTLALVAHARERGAAPFLVVAPTSVVGTWAGEAATFTPGLVVRTITESQARRGTSLDEEAADADVVITSYTLYRLEIEAYAARSWGGLVLDEAQTIKNHQSKTYQVVRRLDVPFRLALSGTPMENRLMELWSLLSVVAPGLYPWPRRFAELVANPVEKEGDAQALEAFRRRIRPFLLRRTKELVAADLPAKQEQVLEVALTPRHRRIYDTHLQRERQTILGLVQDFDKNRIAIFRSLTRLRQLSLDAALVDEKYDGTTAAKVDVLVDHLHELAAEGHRALVFSQFTSFLRRVRARLDREGIASSYLDGRTRRRGQVVDEFKQGDAPVFLISLKAGGVGLTLTEADYCFVLDPWWNPAVEAQAVDRTHRIGQQRPVMVYRMVSSGTIEEKVMELKERKAALFSRVIGDGEGAGVPLGAEDVRALLDVG
ncbi:MAG TPA: DEAD/DEAH box helicase [Nocardioidaceae bacterium]|nr:DEAD/DEAH box helicase [Nocardioidaceae bacterium]